MTGNSPKPAPHFPQGEVRWGFLRLDSSGLWTVDDSFVTATVHQLNADLARSRSVLSAVNLFNSYSRYLDKMVGTPSYALGLAHVDGILRAQARLRGEGGGEGGILKYLETRIKNKFLKGDKIGTLIEKDGIPEAWFFWPITAGGLALSNPLISLSAFRKQMLNVSEKQCSTFENAVKIVTGQSPSSRTEEHDEEDEEDEDEENELDEEGESDDEVERSELPPSNKTREVVSTLSGDTTTINEVKAWKPFDWETANNEIGSTFRLFVQAKLEPLSPSQTSHHKALVGEFVNRGTEVKQKKQVSLGNYYQWVLATYERQIMDMFGSFGFASTQLIPVALIMHLRSESLDQD
ncbi:hypothetical protein HDU93_002890 [Gonapodya sp. JEL0774]|nr:hypothetical protein HDU93_002890 [Gonapodya sp. JEL0774]